MHWVLSLYAASSLCQAPRLELPAFEAGGKKCPPAVDVGPLPQVAKIVEPVSKRDDQVALRQALTPVG